MAGKHPLWLVTVLLNSTVGFEVCSLATLHDLFSLSGVQNIQGGRQVGCGQNDIY